MTSCDDETVTNSSPPEATMLTIPQALRRIKGNLTAHVP